MVVWCRQKRQQIVDRNLPTQSEKYATIRDCAASVGIRTLVETGTNEGDAVFACLGSFDHIYSIELATELFEQASERFSGDGHVEIIHGDSTHMLPLLLERIKEPTLFWLDGHYSGGVTARGEQDTPIVEELGAILNHRIGGHILLIDDARLFKGSDGYPTRSAVKRIVRSKYPHARIETERDIIRVFLS